MMRFRNREHAAQLLAERLAAYHGKNPLVLAIPRGAVPMGKIIADSLGGELDVVLVHNSVHLATLNWRLVPWMKPGVCI